MSKRIAIIQGHPDPAVPAIATTVHSANKGLMFIKFFIAADQCSKVEPA